MRVEQTSLVMGVLATVAACSSSSGTPANSNPPSDAAVVLPTDGMIGMLNPPTMTAPPGPVMCGSKMCSPPSSMIPGIMLGACCRPDNSCGATFMGPGMTSGGMGGTCLSTAPGMADKACPSQMMMGFPISACCTTDGLCGLDFTMIGLGCDLPSDLAPPGMMPAGDGGPPETCAAAAAAAAAADAGGGSDAAPE